MEASPNKLPRNEAEAHPPVFEVVENLSSGDSIVLNYSSDRRGLEEFLISTYFKIIAELGKGDGYDGLDELLKQTEEDLKNNMEKVFSEGGYAPFHIRIYVTTIEENHVYQVHFYDNTGILREKGGMNNFARKVLQPV